MNWRVIDKKKCTHPSVGSYRDWKESLSIEADGQCVYCCITQAHFGGIRNFHVEHYRPKSRWPALTNDYNNLFFSCAICNCFKGDDWPAEPIRSDYSFAHYPNPSLVDYSDFLYVDNVTGEVRSESMTGRYLIEKLHLNRPQLITNRRLKSIAIQLNEIKIELNQLVRTSDDLTKVKLVLDFVGKLSDFFYETWNANPYRAIDTK